MIDYINYAVALIAAFLAGMKLQEHIEAGRKAALIQIGRQTVASAINWISNRKDGGRIGGISADRLADFQKEIAQVGQLCSDAREFIDGAERAVGIARGAGRRAEDHQQGNVPPGQAGSGEAAREKEAGAKA